MKAFERARAEDGIGLAAECLMAFRRLDEGDEERAEVGALLMAEFFHLIRSLGKKK